MAKAKPKTSDKTKSARVATKPEPERASKSTVKKAAAPERSAKEERREKGKDERKQPSRESASVATSTKKSDRVTKEAKEAKEAPAAKKESKRSETAQRDEARPRARDRDEEPRLLKPDLTTYKSPFNAEELQRWRQTLLERRGEISDDIQGLVKDAMEAEDGHTTPNHIAERGSDADLQDMSLDMAGKEELSLWLIDRAMRKIDKGQPLPFGLCEYTKEPIARDRLKLIPWTPLSIEGATYMEQSNLTLEDMLIED